MSYVWYMLGGSPLSWEGGNPKRILLRMVSRGDAEIAENEGDVMPQPVVVITHVFKGGRFERADGEPVSLSIEALPELVAYRTLLVEVSKELWRRDNPDRQRLPAHFEETLDLAITEIRPGSVGTPLVRRAEAAEDQAGLFVPSNLLDEAADLVADTVEAARTDQPLPGNFPKRALSFFDDYGKTLREDEWCEHRSVRRQRVAEYTPQARANLRRWAVETYEADVDVVGTVTMARVSLPRMGITLDDGREIEAVFDPGVEGIVITALKDHATAKVRVRGRAQMSGTGQIQRITSVERVVLMPGGEPPFEAAAKPIWDVFAEIAKDIPVEELNKLPKDGSATIDQRLYGKPKAE